MDSLFPYSDNSTVGTPDDFLHQAWIGKNLTPAGKKKKKKRHVSFLPGPDKSWQDGLGMTVPFSLWMSMQHTVQTHLGQLKAS